MFGFTLFWNMSTSTDLSAHTSVTTKKMAYAPLCGLCGAQHFVRFLVDVVKAQCKHSLVVHVAFSHNLSVICSIASREQHVM